jgi:hypothetical protein
MGAITEACGHGPTVNSVVPAGPPCQPGSLTLQAGRQGEAFGTAEATIVLTNAGSSSCSLSGTPTLVVFRADGSILAVQNSASTHPVLSLTLQPGESAALITNWANWCGQPPGPLRLEVLLPGHSAGVVGTFEGPPNYDYLPRCTRPGEASDIEIIDGYRLWPD